ncbi:MAG: VCBS repeat-containing protein [Deltaproteobacteria bacterium]|nr:VCBS repeat-containing protein [Deltaproteobacteria bacterium]
MDPPATYKSYLLRLWTATHDGEPVWQASLQSISSGYRHGLADMESLFTYLKVLGGGGTIAWYENDGLGNFTTNTITTSDVNVWCVFAADMDGDGDMDVISASESYSNDSITWYENDGLGNFTPYTITTPSARSYRVFAADRVIGVAWAKLSDLIPGL